jgi:hypothetical protein
LVVLHDKEMEKQDSAGASLQVVTILDEMTEAEQKLALAYLISKKESESHFTVKIKNSVNVNYFCVPTTGKIVHVDEDYDSWRNF